MILEDESLPMRTAGSKEQGVLGGEAAVLGRDGGQTHRSHDIVHALKEKIKITMLCNKNFILIFIDGSFCMKPDMLCS